MQLIVKKFSTVVGEEFMDPAKYRGNVSTSWKYIYPLPNIKDIVCL